MSYLRHSPSFYNSDLFGTQFDGTTLVEHQMIVSCEDIVTLHVDIVGDLGTRPILWEQLTGTPVIWLEPQNQATVMWQQPAVRDDKIFRFTIDKGTSYATIRDVLVTAVPFEEPVGQSGNRNTPTLGDLYLENEVISTPKVFPKISLPGTSAVDNPESLLYWGNPINNKFVGSIVQQFINGGWQNISSILSEITFAVPNNASLRILSVYRSGGILRYVPSDIVSSGRSMSFITIDATEQVVTQVSNNTINGVVVRYINMVLESRTITDEVSDGRALLISQTKYSSVEQITRVLEQLNTIPQENVVPVATHTQQITGIIVQRLSTGLTSIG